MEKEKTIRIQLPNGAVLQITKETAKKLRKAHLVNFATDPPFCLQFKPEVQEVLNDVDFSWTAKSAGCAMSGAFFRVMPPPAGGKPTALPEDYARLKRKRNDAGIRLKEVGAALGKSYEWVRLCEDGRLRLSLETVAAIEVVIDELAQLRTQLRAAEAEAREKVFAESKLPRRVSNTNP